jgi:hypothetical protein
MDEIKPRIIEDIDAPVYFISPNGEKYRCYSYCSYMDMRIQIKKAEAEGWSIEYKGERYELTKDAKFVDPEYSIHFPNGIYDKQLNLLAEYLTLFQKK